MRISKIQNLVAEAKIREAIDMVLDYATASKDFELQNSLILLKSRFARVKQQENMGIVTYTDALREQAIISHSLLELISKLNENTFKSSSTINDEVENTRKTILFLGSNPNDTGKLQLEKEFVRISRSLQEGSIDFRLAAEWAITPNELQKAMLMHKPKIVHFSGHGTRGIKGGIVLQDSNGKAQVVTGKALANLFSIVSKRFSIDVVLLNSCYSKEQAGSISQYVKYVIGMNNSINDNAAIEFSTGFYRGLGSEDEVEFAFDLAKNMIMLEGLSDEDIPEIYIDGELK
ncbi:MAG: CHAT domain-containing protein [Spirosomataceae bacterium]